jgi:hypothetical protein
MTKKQAFLRMVGIAVIPALGWLLPAALWGQVASIPAAALYAGLTPAELELKAEDLSTSPDRFGEAGDLLEQAGRLMAVEDPASVKMMIRAARLQYFGGSLEKARASMKEAGWRALGQGQVLTAANAYADAALIAIEQHDQAGAVKLVKIVNLLAQWPGVTSQQAKQIRSRIG